jgi:hypothetical protein
VIVVVIWFGIHHDNDDSFSSLSKVCDRRIEYPVASLVIIIEAILLDIPWFRFGCRPLEYYGCLGTK